MMADKEACLVMRRKDRCAKCGGAGFIIKRKPRMEFIPCGCQKITRCKCGSMDLNEILFDDLHYKQARYKCNDCGHEFKVDL